METRHLSIPLLLPTVDCESCVVRLKEALLQLKGVASAEIDANAARLILTFDPSLLPLEHLERQARKAGIEVAKQFGHQTFRLGGLDCPDCASTLEKSVERMPGIIWVAVSVPASRMAVEYDETMLTPARISRQVDAMGYQVVGVGEGPVSFKDWLRRHRRLIRTIACGLLTGAGWVVQLFAGPAFALSPSWFYLAAVIIGIYPILLGAIRAVRAFSLDMNVLMTIAIIGAVVIRHESEAAAVVFLFALGGALEGYTMERTRRALEVLTKLAPERTRVKRGEGEEQLPTDRVQVGEIIIIRPGERIPLDGRVSHGASSLDESPITGESMPAQKGEGDEVWAGSINQYGSLEVEVTRPASESSLARILSLIEAAEAQKTPSQRMIDRFAKSYTPVVIFLAVAIVAVPALIFRQPSHPWIYRALTLLVVSCPCALVIATPVAIVASLSAAAREGILIKTGLYLEEMAKLRAIALDKTGTLTYGRPRVTDVIGLNGNSSRAVLSLAAAVESRSEHHLAGAVREAALQEGIRPPAATDFQALPGMGAMARVDGRVCFVGAPKMQEKSADFSTALERLSAEGKTVVAVIVAEEPAGLIAFSDLPRSEAAVVVARLKKLGMENLMMLTGDNAQSAKTIADKLGLTEWRAELLPDDKVTQVKALLAKWKTVAMVGDGINDAPALAAASVGIAMGGSATDIALETADIILMGDDLARLPYALELGRKTLAVMRQNILFSVFIKAGFIFLVFPGWLTLWLAVIGDTGVSLIVMLNGMRLLARRASL